MQERPEQTAEPLCFLRANVTAFAQSMKALPDDLFLTVIVNWMPRDIVAHLIGWNRYTLEGCEQIRVGKTPAYLSDADNDFRHVNGVSVKRYAERDRQVLLRELETSFRELEQYLSGLDAAAWVADTGVRYRDRPLTIRNTIRALGRDYDRHRLRVEEWARTKRG